MAISLAYWRPLVFKRHTDAADCRTALERFALEKHLPPLQWVEERCDVQIPWRERTLGQSLARLNKGDYVLVQRLLHLGSSLDECCEIMTFLADRQIFFYDLNSQCHIEREEQFLQWQQALATLQEFRQSLAASRARSSRPAFQGALDCYQEEILFLLQHGASQEFVAQRYGIPLSRLAAWLPQ